ncbi:MAG: helix-turn-helix domain-containing protein [Chloroflexi bacterium]|nr:helix-turn-helix domain-containing protein [Chloroflexota bacterium]
MNNQGNVSDPLVLTPTETARLLRIGRATVYEQLRLGAIPSIRFGRKILIPRAALDKLLANCNLGNTQVVEK